MSGSVAVGLIAALMLLLFALARWMGTKKRNDKKRAAEEAIRAEDVEDLADALKKVLMETQAPAGEMDASHPAMPLALAERVVIVPGQGMAESEAQLQAKQLAFLLEKRGIAARFVLHPSAGHAQGELRALLDEVDVPVGQIAAWTEEMDEPLLACDVCVVVGACDVINPASGIPPIDVERAKHLIICNYNIRPGLSGIENPLYRRTAGLTLLLGDAKDSLQLLLDGLEQLGMPQ